MDARTRLGLSVIAVSLTLGIFSDGLLRSLPWGFNFFLCVTVLSAALLALARRHKSEFFSRERWLWLPLFLFSALCVWRDSPVLLALNFLSVFLTLGFLTLHGLGIQVRKGGVLEYAVGMTLTCAFSLFGAFALAFRDIAWLRLPRGKWTPNFFAAVRGVAIALPLTLIFGALFASADEHFRHLANRFFSFNSEEILLHGVLIAFFTWTFGGFLRGALMTQTPNSTPIQRLEVLSLGFVETIITLGAMNALFLAFTLVQAKYLFGGALRVQSVASLTYATYARSGFYELVAVSILTLPVLLALDWLLRCENTKQRIISTSLIGTQIGLLFVIMASALYRMRLLQNEYGMTELRFYSTAFMFWLVAVFVIFALTVLRGRRTKFAFHTALAAFAMVAVLNVMNPDNIILNINLKRAATGKVFDASYVSRLSADAVPTLIRIFPQFSPADQEEIGSHLFSSWLPPETRDWRTFNVSRTSAWNAVRPHEAQFKTLYEIRLQRRIQEMEENQRRLRETTSASDHEPDRDEWTSEPKTLDAKPPNNLP